jgi:hypothetical protein
MWQARASSGDVEEELTVIKRIGKLSNWGAC